MASVLIAQLARILADTPEAKDQAEKTRSAEPCRIRRIDTDARYRNAQPGRTKTRSAEPCRTRRIDTDGRYRNAPTGQKKQEIPHPIVSVVSIPMDDTETPRQVGTSAVPNAVPHLEYGPDPVSESTVFEFETKFEVEQSENQGKKG